MQSDSKLAGATPSKLMIVVATANSGFANT